MLTLNYDDNAFGFFAIAVLAVFSFSSTVYILRTILTWKEEKLEIRPVSIAELLPYFANWVYRLRDTLNEVCQ